MWKRMTYAQLIATTDNHKTRRHHKRGLDHLRSCWCAQTPAPSSSVGGTTTSSEEQA